MKKYCTRVFSFLLCAALLAGLLLPTAALAIPEMDVAASSAILVDADNGDILYEKEAHTRRYPASITKVMTALLTLEAIDRGELSLDKVVTVSSTSQAGLSDDGSSQNIKPGEQLTVEELLYCTLVASANEACNILGETVCGDLSTFVDKMNQRAQELGMKDTHFANPHGLHDENHYSTAYDIWLMTAQAMKNSTFRTIVDTDQYHIPATNLSAERHFYNTNGLLSNWKYIGYTYSKAIGIKTGSTPEAGQCLVSAAVDTGRTLIAVVLGAQNVTMADGTLDRQSFSESRRLLQWGFANFKRMTIIDETAKLREIKVTLSEEADYVLLSPSGKLEATLPADLKPENFTQEVTVASESVQAPVAKGQILGSVTLTYNGKSYGTLDLVASNSVSRSEKLYTLFRIKTFFEQLWVRLLLIALAVVILILILRHLIFGKRRPRGRYKRYGGGKRRRY